MKEIKLNAGYSTFVDDDDYEWLSQYDWFTTKSNKKLYVKRVDRNGKRKFILMHREILGIVDEPDKITDHIDRNGLNNVRSNLRVVNKFQSNQNRGGKTNAPKYSKYKGVCFVKNRGMWKAAIEFNKIHINLGYFRDEVSAAFTYNQAAIKYHGEFGNLNELPTDAKITNRVLRQRLSKFLGVTWHRQSQRWRAYITYKGKTHTRHFTSEIDAAKGYEELVKQVKGMNVTRTR